MAKEQLSYNEGGTHVHVRHSETDAVWECPIDYLPVAQARGWEPTTAPEPDVSGLFDAATAEGSEQTGFDPAEHTVDEVNEHLSQHAEDSPGEVARVLTLERAGKNRVTIVDPLLGVDPSGD